MVDPAKKKEPEYDLHWNKTGLQEYYLKKINDKTISDSKVIISALNKLGITDSFLFVLLYRLTRERVNILF